ncbi:PP2C family protein-serine/threonine phosphatase [Streptomyces sp. NBC_00316]|uniref:PP2C family protein-serine/threonine phosphatase n=1 Tax=Streptomyces sp. NBC_00316 TaxID=2975710 RepID=UPI002E2C4739|nr:PP2C family protein-serine/threonine phosphatase [Streptomyces sp. NBC_00316]
MTRSTLPLSRPGAGRPKRPAVEDGPGAGRERLLWRIRSGRGHLPTGVTLAQAAVPVALITAITLAATFAPVAVHLSPLLVAAPTATAAFASARFTAGTALAASAAMVVVDRHDGLVHSPLLPIHIVALLMVSGFVVAAGALHDRDLRELTQVRAVAEAAQRVLLRPLPRQLGSLLVACTYRAAAAHALVGGDLYAAARTGRATRFLIGDVRGKGLPAVEDASALLGAFREAAYQYATLPELAAALERSVRRHLAQLTESDPESSEHFITALLVEIPDEAPLVQVISCGHPPLLRGRRGQVTTLRMPHPAPPLGLAGTTPDAYHVDTFDFGPADTLLLYTDGVIEARNATGGFFPILERASTWTWECPHSLLRHINRDVDIHAGGRLEDDLALVAIHRTPAPGTGQGPHLPQQAHPTEARP